LSCESLFRPLAGHISNELILCRITVIANGVAAEQAPGPRHMTSSHLRNDKLSFVSACLPSLVQTPHSSGSAEPTDRMTKTIMSSAYKGACLYVPSRRADRTTQCQGLLPLPILRVLVRQAGERLHPVVARGVTVTKGKDDQLPAVADGGRLRG
jgi:hypothetical protein